MTGQKRSTQKPWECNPNPWNSEAKFIGWVRGVLRKGWSKHPLKITYIHLNRKRIANPKPRHAPQHALVWGMTCQVCMKDHVQGNIEIDHKGESGTFTTMSEIQAYAEHLYMVTYDDLQSVCKECHKIINHSQRHGVSFDDASILKEVIRICKEESLGDIITFCNDYEHSDTSNTLKRKTAIEAILRSVS